MAIAPDKRPIIDQALRSTLLARAGRPIQTVSTAQPELRVERIVDGVFLVIYSLLGTRLVLALLGASFDGTFARLITALTDPLYAVFSGILPGFTSDGRYTLSFPLLLAILLYAVLHGLAKAMLRKLTRRRAYL